MHAVLDADGQMTIPAEIRAELNMLGATLVDLVVRDGRLFITPLSASPHDGANEDLPIANEAREQRVEGRAP